MWTAVPAELPLGLEIVGAPGSADVPAYWVPYDKDGTSADPGVPTISSPNGSSAGTAVHILRCVLVVLRIFTIERPRTPVNRNALPVWAHCACCRPPRELRAAPCPDLVRVR